MKKEPNKRMLATLDHVATKRRDGVYVGDALIVYLEERGGDPVALSGLRDLMAAIKRTGFKPGARGTDEFVGLYGVDIGG